MEELFLQLGIIMIVTTVMALFFRRIRQPPLLAYIIAGVVMGPLVFNLIPAKGAFETFSQIGVAFLLFIVGLSLNLRVLKEVGKVSLYTGVGQVLFTSIIGFFLVLWLGFTPIAALYISIALSFSSTIIIVKLLSDKNDLDTLYGKISVGFLLVQDAIAVLLLIFLSGMNESTLTANLGKTIVNGILFCLIAYLAQRFFLSRFFERTASSQETLFISAIAWCFALSLIAVAFGFTLEIGAFLAGITLASLPYSLEITNKVRPLRDFFVILFFVTVGSSLVFTNVQEQIVNILILSLFVLVGNPIILLVIMGLMGFKSRTGFLCGLTVAQISEFSLVLAALGFQLGHLTQDAIVTISGVGIITIALSTYMITYNEKLYSWCSRYLKFFERKKIYENKLALHKKSQVYDIILLGQHRIGFNILKNLLKRKTRVLVIDYNPTIVKDLIAKNVPCIYGDVADPDVLRELKLHKPKIVISTIHLYEDNVLITNLFKKLDENITVIVTANTIKNALNLYAEGADYVIIPHILGGERVSELLKTHLSNKRDIKKLRKNHIHALHRAGIPQQ